MRPVVKTMVSGALFSTIAIWMPIVLQANAAIAGEKIYKIELQETDAPIQTLEGERYKKIRGRSEWAVLTVNDTGTIQLKYAIRTSQSYGVSTWSNAGVMALNVCPISGQSRACVGLKGDRFTIPKGNNIKDFRFEFQVQDNNRSHVRFVQVPRSFTTEGSPSVNSPRS